MVVVGVAVSGPGRAGPGTAATALRGPFALAWRTHRGPLLAWTAGCAVVGVLLGSAVDGAHTLLGAPLDPVQLVALLVVALALAGAGMAGLRRRDITA